MPKIPSLVAWTLAVSLAAPWAHADLYAAQRVYQAQDYDKAFPLFSELAALGRLEAQEALALMYVEGTGVKRDNALGYAWAKIAIESGSTDVQSIVDQLAPYMTPGPQKRVDEVIARYGREALQKSLLPEFMDVSSMKAPTTCTVRTPANPDDFYPRGTVKAGLSGNVLLDFTIHPDGRARNPRVWFAVPEVEFNEAAKYVVLASKYIPKKVDGVATPCQMQIKVKFKAQYAGDGYSEEVRRKYAEYRTSALKHDPASELMYGLMIANLGELNIEKELATRWILKAAQAGIPHAQFLIAKYLDSGSGMAPSAEKSTAWLEKAAASGHAGAQVALARKLISAPESSARAIELLERAVASGDREGTFFLAAQLAASPDAARRDPARALALLGKIMSEVDIDPTAFEIRAAARAASDDATQAVKDEEQAIKLARRLGWDVGPLEARLDSYRRGQAWTGSLIDY